jgi:hypothetical protein
VETISPAELAECLAPLGIEDRRRLEEHWERVIREEWVPPSRRVSRPVRVAGLDERRERREARRAVGAVVRLVPRHTVSPSRPSPVGPGAAA